MLALEATYLARGTTLVVVTASTDPRWVTEAYTLSRRGIQVSCVMIDPRSFGATVDTTPIQNMIEAAGIQVHTVRQDDDLTAALSYRPAGLRAHFLQ